MVGGVESFNRHFCAPENWGGMSWFLRGEDTKRVWTVEGSGGTTMDEDGRGSIEISMRHGEGGEVTAGVAGRGEFSSVKVKRDG